MYCRIFFIFLCFFLGISSALSKQLSRDLDTCIQYMLNFNEGSVISPDDIAPEFIPILYGKSHFANSDLPSITSRQSDIEEKLKLGQIKSMTLMKESSTNNVYIIEFKENDKKAVWKEHQVYSTSNYRVETLNYQISSFLELDLVPITVTRKIDNKYGSIQPFIEGAQRPRNLTEEEVAQITAFDYLMKQHDRENNRNMIISSHNEVKLYDNGMSIFTKHYPGFGFTPFKLLKAIKILKSNRSFISKLEELYASRDIKDKVKEYIGKEDTHSFYDRIHFFLELEKNSDQIISIFLKNFIKESQLTDDLSFQVLGILSSKSIPKENTLELIKLILEKNSSDLVLGSIFKLLSERQDLLDEDELYSFSKQLLNNENADDYTYSEFIAMVYSRPIMGQELKSLIDSLLDTKAFKEYSISNYLFYLNNSRDIDSQEFTNAIIKYLGTKHAGELYIDNVSYMIQYSHKLLNHHIVEILEKTIDLNIANNKILPLYMIDFLTKNYLDDHFKKKALTFLSKNLSTKIMDKFIILIGVNRSHLSLEKEAISNILEFKVLDLRNLKKLLLFIVRFLNNDDSRWLLQKVKKLDIQFDSDFELQLNKWQENLDKNEAYRFIFNG